ncbi:MAG: glutaredoxin family protein [Smithellaceae bacterium]|nr:glutaredoxin family protein [Smithellaceae bacterium]
MTPKIKLYTLSTCSHCKAAKRFFTDSNMSYECTDVDLLSGEEKAAVMAEVRSLNPRLTFPTIIIGKQVIVGFNENRIKEALGE